MSKVNSRNKNIHHLKAFNSLTPRILNYKNIEEVYKLNFTKNDISPKINANSITQMNNKKNLDVNQLQQSINIVKKIIPNIFEMINFSDKNKSEKKINEMIINQEKEKIEQIKEKRNKLKKSISENYITVKNLENKISDFKLSLYVHSKMEQKPMILLTPNEKLKNNPKFKGKKYKIKKKKELKLDFLRRLRIFKDRLNKKNEEIAHIKNNLSEIEINKNEVLSKIKNLEKEKKELKNIKNNIIEKLYFYYLNNLKEGIDTKNQGLSYTVQEIINLDKRVLLSYFPDYLDLDSIKYILNQAKLKLKLEEEKKEIKKLKSYFSNSIIRVKSNKVDNIIEDKNNKTQNLNLFDKSFKNSEQNKYNNLYWNKSDFLKFFSKTGTSFSNINNEVNRDNTQNKFNIKELINTNKEKEKFNKMDKFNNAVSHSYSEHKEKISFNNTRKINFYNKLLLNQKNINNSPFYGKKKEFSNISSIEDFLKTKTSLINENNIDKINDYFSLNRKIKKMRDDLEENKKIEMKRIFRKYLKRDNSQKTFNEKEKILSALIGKDNAESELRRRKKDKKNYFMNLKINW